MDQNMIYIAVGVAVLLVIALLMANRNKSRAHHPSAPSAQEGGSDEARLAHLADLRSKGLVSEQEFEAQRKQILGKL